MDRSALIMSLLRVCTALLILWGNKAIEIATYKITNYQRGIEYEKVADVGKGKIGGYSKVVERIGYTMRKSTNNEKGDS